MKLKHLFFDRRDHDLIKIVNSVYDADQRLKYIRKLYYPFFHPLGIKELAETRGLRTAYAIVNLLESMERGTIENRLQALRGLKDEILNTADGPMPKNTARVLLQIMKELVRAKGDSHRQLQLAHAFRMAASGKPRVTRGLLRHYHLLEMPEEWNQITFDDHVHDANTSGRKSPTHLIMDAWIKGIRRLRVIYYHAIEPRFAAELIEAAQVMEIDLRIGIEFQARFRDRYISVIWVSRGLPDTEAFLCFLAEPHVVAFMEQGKAVIRYQQSYVLHLLAAFNLKYLDALNKNFQIQVAPLDPDEFLRFTVPGLASLSHLAEYIHLKSIKAMQQRIEQISLNIDALAPEEQEKIRQQVEQMDQFTTRDVLEHYLAPHLYPDLPDPFALTDTKNLPNRLTLDFVQLFEQLRQLHHDFRLTLKLGNLKPEDVLEILYAGHGLVTRLEIINMKDFLAGKTTHMVSVNELKNAINAGSSLKLKRMVQQIIIAAQQEGYADIEDRMHKLINILHDIDALKNMYAVRPIKSRIGSDSTGKSHQAYGMGFSIIPSLSIRAIREIRINRGDRMILPAHISISPRITFASESAIPWFFKHLKKLFGWLPGLDYIMPVKKREWVLGPLSLDMKKPGNIVTLGGIQKENRNGFARDLTAHKKKTIDRSWKNLNSRLKNTIKILFGFIPAFICFFLTKDWWFLAWFGAFIWFSITGFRVILQSVLGGGGLRRSSFLKWNDYVSWERLTDALLFTGFSVPLLDYLVKTLILDRTMGVTVSTSPVMLYSVMAVANGIYLSCHNTFRGLPKAMVTGNFFRSMLSIPVAIFFNSVISAVLAFFNVPAPAAGAMMQKWAAIISKAASDTVAGIIEGTVDRFHNLDLRQRDITQKFKELFSTYTRLELLFPEAEDLKILEKPELLFNNRNSEIKDLTIMIIINALDLFYFWMYLPRTRTAMKEMVLRLTPEERTIFLHAQKLLENEQFISRLFVDGILGKQFSRPLSFYLTTYQSYLSDLENIDQAAAHTRVTPKK